MRAGLTASLQVVLVIAAMSSVSEPASAASCTCTCMGANKMAPRSYNANRCSDLNGRPCSLRASDPAGRAAGILVSGSLTGCSEPEPATNPLFWYRR
jgi:hypothetical protein